MTVGKFVAAVLVSAGRHPFTGTPRACRGDAVAIALGQRIVGHGLRIIHAGAIDEPALNDYLAQKGAFGAKQLVALVGHLCESGSHRETAR